MSTFILKRKNFTKYDETDQLKASKDADILAEKKKKKKGHGEELMSAGTGAGAGAIVGATYGVGRKLKHQSSLNSATRKLKKAAKELSKATTQDAVEIAQRKIASSQDLIKRAEKKVKNKKVSNAIATGAIIGGLVNGIPAAKKRRQENEDIEWYNDRLEFAQDKAEKRERADWRTNMTKRDGYSY